MAGNQSTVVRKTLISSLSGLFLHVPPLFGLGVLLGTAVAKNLFDSKRQTGIISPVRGDRCWFFHRR